MESRSACLVFMCMVLWAMQSAKTSYSVTFNATVALDGSGDFKSVSEAISSVPRNSKNRYVIGIKPGKYKEHVEVLPDMTFISLIGEDAATTVIVDDRSNSSGSGTTKSATVSIKGQGFVAKSLTFENSAGAEKGQAVAFYNEANESAFYQCNFLGFQDTLYAKANSQFYKDCTISGTVDFIFGSANAVFQDCRIFARLPNRTITVTAQSKETPNDNSGFSFQNCTVGAAPGIMTHDVNIFLGRPWRDYSTVIFMQSFLDGGVDPSGWLDWPPRRLDVLYYAEFNNRGPGSDTSKRVNWPGFHVVKDPNEAARFTVEKFIGGNAWLPETGVPYRAGLD